MKMSAAIVVLGCLLIAGCASSKYVESYTAESPPATPPSADFEPKIRRSKDIQADVADLLADGYIVLGSSDFTGEVESDDGIYQQASANGATLVLKKTTFIETKSVDKTVYRPNTTTENTTRVNRGAPSGTYGTTGTNPAAPRKGSIPNTVQQEIFRQQAVFLKRGQ